MQSDLKDQINKEKLPRHIAIIMDGNGRWAKKHGKIRTAGHQSGVISVREVVEGAAELGVSYLTLYAFSTENWNRPDYEINALMHLLVGTINKETDGLIKNGIRLAAIGNIDALPSKAKKELLSAIKKTAHGTRMTLVLALSYSSKWEITEAMKQIAVKVEKGLMKADDVNESNIAAHLNTYEMPDPELLIRTSGEFRISNFLLWQIAYAELYFTEKLWPEFRKNDLYEAIVDFQKRERRFGKISEQILEGK
jgi:undecaprenyl diphosphate synthase